MDRNSLSSELEYGVGSLSLISYGSDLDASVTDVSPTKLIHSSDADTTLNEGPSTSTDATVTAARQRAQQFSFSGLSEKKKREVQAALAEAEAAEAEFLEAEAIYRAYKTVITSGKLPQPTRENAQKLWRRQELKSYVGAGEGPGLLGLTEEHLWMDCPRKLSEKDQKIVKLAVENQLIENARELKEAESSKLEILNKLSGNISSSTGPKAESDHTSRMSTLRTELNNELDKFYKLLVSLDSILETIVQMRTNKMTETCAKTIGGYEAKAQLLKEKARLLNLEIQSAIYSEDANILSAVRRLEKDMDILYSEMEMELSEAKGLLASYEKVRGPEYDKILKEYQHVRKEIKSLQYLLQQNDKDLMPTF